RRRTGRRSSPCSRRGCAASRRRAGTARAPARRRRPRRRRRRRRRRTTTDASCGTLSRSWRSTSGLAAPDGAVRGACGSRGLWPARPPKASRRFAGRMRRRPGRANRRRDVMSIESVNPPEIERYVREQTLRETEAQLRLRRETAALPDARMLLAPEVGGLLALLVRLIGARRVLELG